MPAFNTASQVGFGAVVAALPAFALVREGLLALGGGPLVSLPIATGVISGIIDSASGGMIIALETLGETYVATAAQSGIDDPGLMHRVAVMGTGTLDTLPHNGAVVTLLAVSGATHRESYRDIAVAGIVGPLVALVVVIALGSALGSF